MNPESSASISASISSTPRSRLLSLGLLSDTQYVDDDDGSNFDGSRVRRYRQSLELMKEAAQYFQAAGMQFCVLLGDVLDMRIAENSSMANECLSVMKAVADSSGIDWHFVVGNHDLHCFPREKIFEVYIPPMMDKESTCSPSKLYYSFQHDSAPHFRFIVLDAFDVSWIQPSSPQHKEDAIQLLLAKNRNLSYYAETNKWSTGDWCAGLSDDLVRFVPAGGGLSREQLEWLDNVLMEAHRNDERCLVFCHMPCYAPCTLFPECLLWNSEDLLCVLQRYPHTVIAYFAGHDHTGGNAVDDCGIHHIIPVAPIECAVGDKAFGVLHVMDDNVIDIEWIGATPPEGYFEPFPESIAFKPSAILTSQVPPAACAVVSLHL